MSASAVGIREAELTPRGSLPGGVLSWAGPFLILGKWGMFYYNRADPALWVEKRVVGGILIIPILAALLPMILGRR